MKIDHITLFLTARCNMQCSYCYLGHKNTDIMSWETAEKAVNLLTQSGGEKSISFFGGEPLLQSDLLFSIADYVKKRFGSRINLSVTTNGILLTPNVMEKLQKNNIFVVLSIDGYGEAANRYRKLCNGKNYWPILEYNLKHILVKDIGAVRMTVVPDSVAELYYNYSCLLSRGFDHINFALDYMSTWTDKDLEIYEKQFAKILQLYFDQIVQERKVCIDFVDHIVQNVLGKVKTRCCYGFGSVAVSAKGYVFPCHREVMDIDSDKGIPIDEYPLKDSLRENICIEKQDMVCRECVLYDRCSICMINIKKMGGSLEDIPELMCNVNKIHIFETDNMLKRLYTCYRKQFQKKYQ